MKHHTQRSSSSRSHVTLLRGPWSHLIQKICPPPNHGLTFRSATPTCTVFICQCTQTLHHIPASPHSTSWRPQSLRLGSVLFSARHTPLHTHGTPTDPGAWRAPSETKATRAVFLLWAKPHARGHTQYMCGSSLKSKPHTSVRCSLTRVLSSPSSTSKITNTSSPRKLPAS